jgi:hypothetical protein
MRLGRRGVEWNRTVAAGVGVHDVGGDQVLSRKGAVVAAGGFVVLNVALLRLGCSSTATTTPTTRPPTSSVTSTALPGRASTARVSFTGGAGLTGAVTNPSVRCNFPVLEGLSIAVLAQPPDATLLTRIGVRSGKVKVFVSSGSGPDYHERAFEGTGVAAFDSAKGARIDSTLTETPATAGATGGSLGAITAIKGSVECGDQTSGTSTVTITGDTAEGSLASAVLDPVRVECAASPDGDEVVALGLMAVGETNALVKLGLTSDGGVTVDETLPSGSHRYVANGASTITSTGAHVRADLVERGTATPAHRLHVEGDLSCGTQATG